MGLSHQLRQVGTIVPRSPTCRLRQNELSFQIDNRQPLQPMPPRTRLLRVVVHTAHKERAHRTLGQSRGIDRRVGAASETGQLHTMNHSIQGVSDSGFVQSSQETVQSRAVGNRAKPQSTAQFRVFGQSHFGFSIGPLLVDFITRKPTDIPR